MTFKVTQGHWYGNDVIRYTTHDCFHRNYVSILYRFRDIVAYLPKFRGLETLNTLLSRVTCDAYASTHYPQPEYQIGNALPVSEIRKGAKI